MSICIIYTAYNQLSTNCIAYNAISSFADDPFEIDVLGRGSARDAGDGGGRASIG
jgi:hypothetical protein